jgi:hypothetical protein
MSFENTQLETIYMRLLNEGTEVARPVPAVRIGDLTFVVILTPQYDPELEDWEFPPGSIVKCQREMWSGSRGAKEEILVARETYYA